MTNAAKSLSMKEDWPTGFSNRIPCNFKFTLSGMLEEKARLHYQL
jgi:hypothetical protein